MTFLNGFGEAVHSAYVLLAKTGQGLRSMEKDDDAYKKQIKLKFQLLA